MSLKCSNSKLWSSVSDEILINFVRNHEAIFNVKHKDYRNAPLKQLWWREIGEILKKEDNDCCKRWSYIRDYYIRRKAKQGRVSSGEAALRRAELLSFLDTFPSSSKVTNIDENSGDNSCEQIDVAIVKTDQIEDSMEDIPDYVDEELSDIQDIHNEPKEDPICESSDDEKNNYIKMKRLKRMNSSAQRITILEQLRNSELDENDLFFASMAKIVKKLPRYEQARLRVQIGTYVGNAELRHIPNNLS